jgi:serine/threonine-protein kinase
MSDTSATSSPVRRLEELWKQGSAPDLQRFLSSAGDLSADDIVALCRVDQRAHWAKGERVLAETYFRLRSTLSTDIEHAVELIYGEYLLREQLGDAPTVQEYQERFPQFAERLRQQFSFHRALESDSFGSRASTSIHWPVAPSRTAMLIDQTVLPAEVPSPRRRGEFDLLGEIGRGGMGVVYRARDPELGRDLAVKVLLDEHLQDPHARWRFFAEAQIAGQLQHPGIAPVHELGQLGDGRPYFTMKLIQGRTLADLLKARAEVGQDRPRFLNIFEQVCQTVAFAHSRGVIHRDLKPANVMVGAFGEVQVMDWGLAKVLHALNPIRDDAVSDLATAAPVRTVRSDTPQAASTAGAVLGTLAYMPPEQARGTMAAVDERGDVYGLGAILVEILTGSPPSVNGLIEAMEAKGAQNAYLRLKQCEGEPALVSLATRCLAVDREDRPRNAGVVATEIRTYLDSVDARLRQAELARVEAQAKAVEERKRRRVTLGLAAAVLALALVGGAWTWHSEKERADRLVAAARLETEVGQLLEEARRHQRNEKYPEAHAAVREAEGRLQSSQASGDMRQQIAALRGELDFLKELDAISVLQAEPGARTQDFDLRQALPLYRKAFLAYGLNPGATDAAEVATQLGTRYIRTQILAALLDWAALTDDATERHRLEQIMDAAAAEQPWLDKQMRTAVINKDAASLRRAVAAADADRLPPAALARIGRTLYRTGAVPDALEWLTRAQKRHPSDFWLNLDLAYSFHLSKPPQLEEALRYYTAALSLRPQNPFVHQQIGTCLESRGRHAQALSAFEQALQLRPDLAGAHMGRGNSLFNLGRFSDAIDAYTIAVGCQPDNAGVYANLGACLSREGRLEEAIAAYLKAIELKPDSPEAFINLGSNYLYQGKFAEALDARRRGHELGSKQTHWPHPSEKWVRDAERLVELNNKLPAIWEGNAEPADVAETLELAYLCTRYKQCHAAAAKFYAAAFAAEPSVVDDRTKSHRYEAACAAAQAAAGAGENASTLGEEERARWFRQALDWLNADLAIHRKRLEADSTQERAAARKTLGAWRRDKALASLRNDASLARYGEAEREACRKLWAHIDELLADSDKK